MTTIHVSDLAAKLPAKPKRNPATMAQNDHDTTPRNVLRHRESKTMRTLREIDSRASLKERADSIMWHDIYTEGGAAKKKANDLLFVSKFMVHPNHPIKIFFDMVVMLCILSIGIMLPIEIAFDINTTAVLEGFFYVIFGVDLVLGFHTGFWHRGQLVLNRWMASKRYMTTWFVIDILSLLPFDMMTDWLLRGDADTLGSSFKATKVFRATKTLRALRALRLIRLMRIVKIPNLCQSMSASKKIARKSACMPNPAIGVLLRNFALLIFLCHVLGCSYYLIGVIEYPDSWIARRGLHEGAEYHNYGERYAHSVYWAFTTVSTVGYGDVSAGSPAEMFFAMFSMGIGVIWTGLTVASVTQALADLNFKAQLVGKKQKEVSRFIQAVDLPPEVTAEVEGFFRGGKDTDRLIQFEMAQQLLCQQYSKILDEMPPKLRSKVIICMRASLLQRLPFLNGADRQFVTNFVLHCRLKAVAPGSMICAEGTPSSGIIVAVEGHVTASHMGATVAVAKVGQIFGLLETHNNLCYMLSLKSSVESAILLMDAENVRRLFGAYPEMLQELLNESEKTLERLISIPKSRLVRRNSHSCIEKYSAGSVIIRQGDVGVDAYKIVDGEVRVLVKFADGRKKTVAILHAGDTFGEIASSAESQRRTATCIAKDDVLVQVLSAAKESDELDRGLEGLEIDVYVQTDLDLDGSESDEEMAGTYEGEKDDWTHDEGPSQIELAEIRQEQSAQRGMLRRIEFALESLLARQGEAALLVK